MIRRPVEEMAFKALTEKQGTATSIYVRIRVAKHQCATKAAAFHKDHSLPDATEDDASYWCRDDVCFWPRMTTVYASLRRLVLQGNAIERHGIYSVPEVEV